MNLINEVQLMKNNVWVILILLNVKIHVSCLSSFYSKLFLFS